jgi:GT2 family glycosyltransferase
MWELTHQRLMDLYKFAPDYCEIILIDDASTEPDCASGIAWWQKTDFIRHKIRYYKNPENVGFGQSNNNGYKLAKGTYLIFLSNDVMVSGDFITDIVDLIGKDNKMLIGGRIVDWAGGWNEFDINGKHYVIPYAEGWLLGCTKIAWKGLGGFDVATYGKFDYEDLDLSTKALSLGYNIVGLNSNKLNHLGSQTISKLNIDRQSITEHNRKVFIDKWISVIPTLDLG